MIKAGIAFDSWKLPIFERHLKQAGYVHTAPIPFPGDCKIITVHTNNPEALATVIAQAQQEAAMTGKPDNRYVRQD